VRMTTTLKMVHIDATSPFLIVQGMQQAKLVPKHPSLATSPMTQLALLQSHPLSPKPKDPNVADPSELVVLVVQYHLLLVLVNQRVQLHPLRPLQRNSRNVLHADVDLQRR
jgi:hypothetical protein